MRIKPLVLGAISILCLSGLGAMLYGFAREQSFACGTLDRSSGCISRTKLDIAALGLSTDTTQVLWHVLDLNPDGSVALVGLASKTMGEAKITHTSLAATFDARTGKPIHVLKKVEGEESRIHNASFSPDGSYIAVSAVTVTSADSGKKHEPSLTVFKSSDASLAKEIPIPSDAGKLEFVFRCDQALGFSPDNTKLQCNLTEYDIETGGGRSYFASGVEAHDFLQDGKSAKLMHADFTGDTFSPWARAANGLHISRLGMRNPDDPDVKMSVLRPDGTTSTIKSELPWPEAPDATREIFFSRNASQFLEAKLATDWRGIVPERFRALSNIGVWDTEAQAMTHRFAANKRYMSAAWTRDGRSFAMLAMDFTLDTFKVP
jgi:hypothetical protein